MNAGQRINLRLRPPGDMDTFYEYDQLVLVMLHEVSLVALVKWWFMLTGDSS